MKPGDIPIIPAPDTEIGQEDVFEVLMTKNGYALFNAIPALLDATKAIMARNAAIDMGQYAEVVGRAKGRAAHALKRAGFKT